jgi:hypothetical protein
MPIRPVGAEFHADGRIDSWIDMSKLTVAFRNFANAPKNLYNYVNYQLKWNLTETYFLSCGT